MTPKGHDPHFLSVPQLLALPDPDWLIEGWLQEQAIATLVGASQAYKSFLALDWALHIAYGLPWYGHKVKQGPTVYIAAEGGGGQRKRVAAWFHVHPDCDPTTNVFRCRTRGVNLFDEHAPEHLCTTIQQWKTEGVKLIIFDTLARSMHGDENAAETMNLVLYEAEKLQFAHHAAILFLHHTGHKNKDRARGSSALPGGIDTDFFLERTTAMQSVLSNTKQKDEELAKDLTIILQKVELPSANGKHPQTSLVVTEADPRHERDPGRRRLVLQYHRKHPRASHYDIAAALDIPRQTVSRYLQPTPTRVRIRRETR